MTSIQPQKLFRGLSVSARCTYCQWGNQKREESSYTEWRRVVLLQMCGYTIVVSTYPILPFQKESGMTGLFIEAPEKRKTSCTISQPKPPQFKSWNGFLFNSFERLSSCGVGFEYSPFCLSGTASATIWRPLSALALPFQEGKWLPQRAIVTWTTLSMQTHVWDRGTHVLLYTQSCGSLNYTLCITTAFLLVRLVWLKKLSLIHPPFNLLLILIAAGLAVVFVSLKRGIY